MSGMSIKPVRRDSKTEGSKFPFFRKKTLNRILSQVDLVSAGKQGQLGGGPAGRPIPSKGPMGSPMVMRGVIGSPTRRGTSSQ